MRSYKRCITAANNIAYRGIDKKSQVLADEIELSTYLSSIILRINEYIYNYIVLVANGGWLVVDGGLPDEKTSPY